MKLSIKTWSYTSGNCANLNNYDEISSGINIILPVFRNSFTIMAVIGL